MSYKFDSLMIILNKLDGKERVSVQSLADELEVSKRTVHRYISTLQVAGFPIIYDHRRESYDFEEGFSLRKPALSLDEVLAFALAKSMVKSLGPGLEHGLQRVEEKLTARSTELPRHIVLKSRGVSSEIREHLECIHRAITDYRQIEMEYRKLSTGETAVRLVDPYYVFFHDEFWYLRGYCHSSEAMRTFALDRVASLEETDRHFLPRQIAPETELEDTFGAWIDGETQEVVLLFDREFKHNILRKDKWFEHQKERELENGKLELRFPVKGLRGVKKWIYQWIPFVEVVGPEELRAEIREELSRARQLHSD